MLLAAHSLTHHSVTNPSLTHPLTQSLTQPTHTHTLTHSLTHSLNRCWIHTQTRSNILMVTPLTPMKKLAQYACFSRMHLHMHTQANAHTHTHIYSDTGHRNAHTDTQIHRDDTQGHGERQKHIQTDAQTYTRRCTYKRAHKRARTQTHKHTHTPLPLTPLPLQAHTQQTNVACTPTVGMRQKCKASILAI